MSIQMETNDWPDHHEEDAEFLTVRALAVLQPRVLYHPTDARRCLQGIGSPKTYGRTLTNQAFNLIKEEKIQGYMGAHVSSH